MAADSTSFPIQATEGARDRDPGARVRVLIPLPLDEPYDYLPIAGRAAPPAGSYVRVPLGPRPVVGIVWDDGQPPDDQIASARLKPVLAVYDEVPPLPAELRRLVDFVAGYTLAPLGAVLRMAMGPSEAWAPEPLRRVVVAAERQSPPGDKLTAARRRVLDVAADGVPRRPAELADQAGCGTSVVRALIVAGWLEEREISGRAKRLTPDPGYAPLPLSPAQQDAAREIEAVMAAPHFQPFLLDGVTGSGKTEVYFAAIRAALAAGKQVLVLLPEISLGAQWHERFEAQFGAPAAAWHSGVGSKERQLVWRDVAEGTASVVVGARSALFLPFRSLGLIVVDEEHDASFKQEDGVVYHARDMAVMRAQLHAIPIVLASATPSLETLVNCERGRYRRLALPDRYGGATLPRISLLDLRRDKPPRQRFIAPSLVKALEETLAQGEQAMLFLNRRGYAPLTLCRSCGHRLQCPNCTAWLVEHRLMQRLICHHCGHAERPPERCPSCDDRHSFAACGPGVERLAEEAAALFPEARLGVMASDSLAGPLTLNELVRKVAAHEIDLLIGTQIVAKGHHFPMLTLVGVVDADLGLNGGDLRAAERTYQLLHQVAGRAGRADRPGRVILQSFEPEHPVMQALASGGRDRFLALEAEGRQRHGWPPYGRLAALIVSDEDEEAVDAASATLARAAPHLRGLDVLGPAPAPLAVLRSRHRRRFLVKTRRDVNLQAVLRQWLAAVRIASHTRVQVDVDPYSFV